MKLELLFGIFLFFKYYFNNISYYFIEPMITYINLIICCVILYLTKYCIILSKF